MAYNRRMTDSSRHGELDLAIIGGGAAGTTDVVPVASTTMPTTSERLLAGVAMVTEDTGAYLLATVGPSKVWLFRWPLRLVEYGWLGLLLGFAVVLSQGLERTHARRRLVASGVIVISLGNRKIAIPLYIAGFVCVTLVTWWPILRRHWARRARSRRA